MPDLIYFSDPMCSWCWGFSPVIEALRSEFAGKMKFHLIMGGLRPGVTEPMDKATGEMIQHHWEEVHRRSGQPFDMSFFEREGFVYDTEPPARAVVAARKLNPALAFDFLKATHYAFYAENRDTHEPELYGEIAASFGLNKEEFLEFYGSDEAKKLTQEDFALTKSLGVRGFPTTVLQQGEKLKLLSHGWRPFEDMKSRLEMLAAQMTAAAE